MVNDTTTLNGSLMELGETMASNLTAKGVSASANEGLTTLANKINQIYTGECYFLDSLDPADYILRDDTIASVTVEENAIKIANTAGANKSVFFTLNRGPIIGNWKATYQLKTNNTVTLYHRIATSRTGTTASHNANTNQASFVDVEWTVENGTMTVKINVSTFGTATYTDTTAMYYPMIAFYFNANEYALIKDLKIVKI